jgi:hypothetical protein
MEKKEECHVKKLICLSVAIIGFLSLVNLPVFGELISAHYANPLVEGVNGEAVVFDYIPDEGAGASRGGPFMGTLYHADNTTNVWKTFCVEADGGEEDFNPGSTYKVWSTTPNVAKVTLNYITDEAKWLYYQSLHDPSLLVGYTGDLTSDNYLQQAIWHGVLKSDSTPLDMPFDATAQTWFAAAQAAVVNWDGADLVRVMNPADPGYDGSEGPQRQSMLYEVPEPSSFVLLGIASVGLFAGVWRRRCA